MNWNSLWFNPLNYSETYFILFMYVYTAFDTSNMTNKLLKYNLMYCMDLFFISLDMGQLVLYYIIFVQPCKIACSMQHGPLTPPTYPGSCKTCFFPHTRFWWESFLHISNHWPMKWPTAHLHISLFDIVNPLISAENYPGWHNYSL